jgi:hypothetical protein
VIRGYFDPTAARPVPKVRIALLLPGAMTSFAVVDFLVDTGAMVTTLSPLDAASPLGIDPSRLAELLPSATPSSIRGVGGEITTFVAPAVYGFRHDTARYRS